jgi:hypothetical protein
MISMTGRARLGKAPHAAFPEAAQAAIPRQARLGSPLADFVPESISGPWATARVDDTAYIEETLRPSRKHPHAAHGRPDFAVPRGQWPVGSS